MGTKLSPSQFTVGIPNEVKHVSLVLPFGDVAENLLLVPDGVNYWVVFLDGSYQFEGYNSQRNIKMSGLCIPGVEIDIDIGSAFDGRACYFPHGSLRRFGDELAMAIRWKNSQGFTEQRFIPLFIGLPSANSDGPVGFRKWHLRVRAEPKDIELQSIEVEAIERPPR